jgi:hypothetical protein
VVVATFTEPVATCGEWRQGWTTLQSISSTFYVSVLSKKVLFLPKSFRQNQNVTREKQHKALLYEKRVHKMLMKLFPMLSKI